MADALVLIRLAAFLCGAVLFGAPLLARIGGVNPPGLRQLLRLTAFGAALAALATLPVQTGQMAGDPVAGLNPAILTKVVLGTLFGASVAVRLAATLGALGLAVWRPDPASASTSLMFLGATNLASLAFAGHGAANPGVLGALHTLADMVHLLAAGAWIGGLALLLLLLFGARATPEAETARQGLVRFAGIGSAAVAALIASGVVNLVFLAGISNLGRLGDGDWGRLLLTKLALFALMLMLAASNRLVLTPRLTSRLNRGLAEAPPLTALRWSVAVESLLGLGVLAIVASLGLHPPPAAGP